MEIPNLGVIENCELPNELVVLQSGKTTDNNQRNQLLRIVKKLDDKGLSLDNGLRPCLGDTLAILLVDRAHQLRGAYKLDQAEMNRFFAELDILLMNEKYGEGISR
jgi:hypothetical protein